jgi:tRNA (mo5U34)-methyltransferase
MHDRWPSELEVAAALPIEATADEARQVLSSVPFWFHTFLLNREFDLYTPGEARDHGYRLGSIPKSFQGLRVLDVGPFDGFYSFLAETRGATRVLAVDNEQYVHWVRDRWGIQLEGGEGFRAIHRLLRSNVEYRRADAAALRDIQERFDFIFCFGILHRVENPRALLDVLTSLLAEDGRILIETYGVPDDANAENGARRVNAPGTIYPNDGFVYWQFSSNALRNLAALTNADFELHSTPVVDGHPRIIGTSKRRLATSDVKPGCERSH